MHVAWVEILSCKCSPFGSALQFPKRAIYKLHIRRTLIANFEQVQRFISWLKKKKETFFFKKPLFLLNFNDYVRI